MPFIRTCGSCGQTLELITSNHFPSSFSVPKVCPGCKTKLAPPDFERFEVSPVDPNVPWFPSP